MPPVGEGGSGRFTRRGVRRTSGVLFTQLIIRPRFDYATYLDKGTTCDITRAEGTQPFKRYSGTQSTVMATHEMEKRADAIATAYGHSIEAERILYEVGLQTLARDQREIRNLVYAELLNLYLNTNDLVRKHLHRLGVGDRLLEDAKLILRAEGERRRRTAKRAAKEDTPLKVVSKRLTPA